MNFIGHKSGKKKTDIAAGPFLILIFCKLYGLSQNLLDVSLDFWALAAFKE